MKLQLALDEHKLEDALDFAEQVADYVDIIEIGTPFVIDSGMEAVRRFKEKFPEKEILSDEKIMDGGYYESQLGFEAGAEYVTALGVSDLVTIKGCIKAADDFKKQTVVDMICVEDMPKRIEELEGIGAHVLAVHTGADVQVLGRTPLDDLKVYRGHARGVFQDLPSPALGLGGDRRAGIGGTPRTGTCPRWTESATAWRCR